jgi:hypothetical protein
MTSKDGSYITEQQLQAPLTKALKNYKEQFYAATRVCDTMNTNLDGKITFNEFRNYCLYNPQGMDFLVRLTLGPYPPSQAL